ncbi:MAG: hypothetical protein WEB58_11945 [Planctomycetaceae bacterium]
MLPMLWLSIVLAPLLDVGAFLRLDQYLFPVLFVISLLHMRRRRADSRGAALVLMFAVLSVIVAGYGSLVTSEWNLQFLFKWPALFAFNTLACFTVIWWSNERREDLLHRSLWWLQICLFVAGSIGLLQALEHHNKLPTRGVTGVLNTFYPYYGELTDNAHMKADGNNMRTGGAGRITSVFDGHPILAGDFFAVCLILTLPLARGMTGCLLAAVPTLAMFLTLSRGSILAWMIGIFAYMGFLALRPGASKKTVRVFAQVVGVTVGLFAVTMFTPLGETILWRIEGTLETFDGTGVDDGRTDKVWPMVIAALDRSTLAQWVFGFAHRYDGPADSQYLFTLINSGLSGVFLLLVFHFQLMRLGLRYSRLSNINGRYAEEGIAFAAAIVALLTIYTVHPALQNRRLLSAFITIAMLVPHVPKYLRTRFSAERTHDRQNRTPHDGASARRRPHFPQRVRQPAAGRV